MAIQTASQKAAALRAEAERVEQEEHLKSRLALQGKLPVCPNCGSVRFTVGAYGVAEAIWSHEDPGGEGLDPISEDGDWEEDSVTTGDHGNESVYATCEECSADATELLRKHGWRFYETAPKGATALLKAIAAGTQVLPDGRRTFDAVCSLVKGVR